MAEGPSASTAINVDRNAAINEELIKKAAEFSAQLQRFGLVQSSDYKLAPALGGTIVGEFPAHTATIQTAAFGNIATPVV